MITPGWVLALAFWLHMLATVVWIGGLSTLALLILPAAQRTLDSSAYASFLEEINRRLDPIGWLSLAVLTATGLVQMGANPNYEGLFAFSSDWAQALLIKHLVFGGMIVVSGYLTWNLTPALQRAALRRARGQETPEAEALQRRETQLTNLNLVLGVVVLLLTALARVA